ncbi:3-dehydroquinate synthase [Marinilongibacter aquaticus]|uniref:3-dehydroquinate synthase n=1 Tax=Marinilongibacter aquaticus TaxID=2975157 RepID=UPI0021BDA400|nr:3-dehydroquinate synthase [Marinilongibacter aquaticus]UBM58502.1 3-dehydroquinate synthase [Marinilongibacter aquaticus]
MNIVQDFKIPYHYEIAFTEGLFTEGNTLLADILQQKLDAKKSVKVAIVLDEGLAEARPSLLSDIHKYFQQNEAVYLAADPLKVKGGEDVKNDTGECMKVLELVDKAKIDRHSFLLIIGGGAVLDMAGFAASIAHRGIRHIRVPSTVLSQNDSGVGVKNGINFFGKKNFLGAFVPPFAVINDFTLLDSLSDRDWLSGIAEAVKVSLIKEKAFFEWLEQNAIALKNRDMAAMKQLIFDCARLHSDHISNSNDPFEMGSSRPLDYGHWAAHKLEQLTNFGLKHGEAVAIGLALDLIYGNLSGFMDDQQTERAIHVLQEVGFNLFHSELLNEAQDGINPELLKGLEEFREHLGGELTITMVGQIGSKFDVHEMDAKKLEKAVLLLKERNEHYAY